jgi:hypothetical protein
MSGLKKFMMIDRKSPIPNCEAAEHEDRLVAQNEAMSASLD